MRRFFDRWKLLGMTERSERSWRDRASQRESGKVDFSRGFEGDYYCMTKGCDDWLIRFMQGSIYERIEL